MLNETQAREVVGATVYDNDGDKVGKVGQLFLDDQTGRPEFVTVNTGFFGTSESFVPVEEATLDGGELRVPYAKQQIKDAPHVDLDGGHLDEGEEQRLFEHYGLGDVYSAGRTDDAGEYAGLRDHDRDHERDVVPGAAGTASETGQHVGGRDDAEAWSAAPAAGTTSGTTGGVAAAGHDTSGPDTDEAMTRSEEHLEVGTREQEAGRARLRKYVTTETETVTVPVRKERAVLETEPITDANAGEALDGPAISEEEHEVVLHEERPVAQTVTEPVERVRLGTETVEDEETVAEDVRSEHIEVEGDVDRR